MTLGKALTLSEPAEGFGEITRAGPALGERELV